MSTFSLKTQLALGVSSLMILGSLSTVSFAQSDGTSANGDEVISTGTRRKARSAADSPAPVDVISGVEFTNQASGDLGDLLRTVVPSYNINAQPISDAASIIRPANLRGLSPDNTLVLINGKRRHRGSVISFLGGGISDGAQGVDISVIPTIGLKQVEVLRDGASSQYGSDAIAGVMNFILKDSPDSGQVELSYGSTYDGDGDNYKLAANIGLPLGDNGFVNISGEYSDTDGTVRASQRPDVAALIAAGNTAVADNLTINTFTDEYAQYWGTPDVKDNITLFVNSAYEFSENAEVYAFGNYSEREVQGGFFYRNPTNRGGVYRGPQVNPITGNSLNTVTNDNGTPADVTDDFDELFDSVTNALVGNPSNSILVGDLDGLGAGGACVSGIPLTGTDGLIADPAILAAVTADPNCFSFVETIPSGFTPRFGGKNRDYSIAGGVRGELDFGNGLGYDVSGYYGTNKTTFAISNTINASLGPNTPRSFTPGAYEQTETGFNLDLTYAVPVSGWASDLDVAAGFEWRDEQFDITAGDPASFALGPLADQGFSSSSNGFGGFSESSSNSESNIGVYGELEADITDSFTLQLASRYSDYQTFGDGLTWKVGGLYHLTDNFTLRSTYSTGFHAPTSGQANVKNVTTQINNGLLLDQGTLPLSSNPGQLAADFLEFRTGVRPELGTETADNLSLGVAFSTGPVSWTVDYFNIRVKDRIANSEQVAFLDALNYLADAANEADTDPTTLDGALVAGYDGSTVSTALTTLAAANALVRSDYTGFEDLTTFQYFTNSFDTKTTGFDIIAHVPFDIGAGSSNLTLAANYTETKVTDSGTDTSAPLGATRIRALEDLLPNWRGNVTFNHEQGIWRGLARVNYFGPWYSTGNAFDVGGEFTIDAEIGAKVMENIELIVGVANAFDNYPDENPGPSTSGQLYPEASPMGFNGGQYYIKGRYTF